MNYSGRLGYEKHTQTDYTHEGETTFWWLCKSGKIKQIQGYHPQLWRKLSLEAGSPQNGSWAVLSGTTHHIYQEYIWSSLRAIWSCSNLESEQTREHSFWNGEFAWKDFFLGFCLQCQSQLLPIKKERFNTVLKFRQFILLQDDWFGERL